MSFSTMRLDPGMGSLPREGTGKVRFSASAPTLPGVPSLKCRDLNLDVNSTHPSWVLYQIPYLSTSVPAD